MPDGGLPSGAAGFLPDVIASLLDRLTVVPDGNGFAVVGPGGYKHGGLPSREIAEGMIARMKAGKASGGKVGGKVPKKRLDRRG